ncbi:uncharacterized protein LOC122242930 [Penaeus japonicus]|uniref:uncharacterized protein LOC122242930 n=1 Tax=Penaeus japonicus TaxID=27405 RepID=UPI001C70E074|nr:uncharacterized protein LOC122242930 [Penaeus japonicus]XP_042856297.1 uncharacterized protein LOC122242930 [Penaeus japonicus]
MLDLKILTQPSVATKAIETALLVTAVSLFAARGAHWTFFVISTMVGGLLNALVLLVCFLLGYTLIQKTPFEMVLSIYYTLAMFVSSVLLIATGYSVYVTCGVLCLVLSFVYGADIYFTYLNVKTGNPTCPSTMNYPPSTMNCPPSSVNYPPSTINYPPPGMSYTPPEYLANSPIGPRP